MSNGAAEDTVNVVLNQWVTEIGIDEIIEILDQAVERLEEQRDRINEKVLSRIQS